MDISKSTSVIPMKNKRLSPREYLNAMKARDAARDKARKEERETLLQAVGLQQLVVLQRIEKHLQSAPAIAVSSVQSVQNAQNAQPAPRKVTQKDDPTLARIKAWLLDDPDRMAMSLRKIAAELDVSFSHVRNAKNSIKSQEDSPSG